MLVEVDTLHLLNEIPQILVCKGRTKNNQVCRKYLDKFFTLNPCQYLLLIQKEILELHLDFCHILPKRPNFYRFYVQLPALQKMDIETVEQIIVGINDYQVALWVISPDLNRINIT